MAMSAEIGRKVCGEHGHKIETHIVADEVLNMKDVIGQHAAPVVAHKYETFCVQCGLNTAQLLRLRGYYQKPEKKIEVHDASSSLAN